MTMPYNQFGAYNPIYNPNLTPQQRLLQYDNMQMQPQQVQTQQMQQTQQSQQGLICCQVTNIQEAQAFQMPIGSIGVFLDLSNSNVYIKKPLGLDGKPEFKTYVSEQQQEEKKHQSSLDERISNVEKEIEILKKYPINKNKKDIKDVE